MKKCLLVSLCFFLVFIGITSGSGIINAGFDENTYGIVTGTTDLDKTTESTIIILLATGVIGFFRISRSKLKR